MTIGTAEPNGSAVPRFFEFFVNFPKYLKIFFCCNFQKTLCYMALQAIFI